MSFLDSGDLYGKTFKEKVYLATDIAKSAMAITLEAHPNIHDHHSISILEAQVKPFYL